MSNYIDDLLKLHYKQTDKGYGKYGKPLEQHDAEILERLQHLQEELMDALHYTFWLGEKLREERYFNGLCDTCMNGCKTKDVKTCSIYKTKVREPKHDPAGCWNCGSISCSERGKPYPTCQSWMPKKEDTNV